MTEPQALDLADDDTATQIWHLQRAAYAVEAELIGFDGIPPLRESLAELRSCGESFLGTHDAEGLVGAVSWLLDANGTLDICRLVVHPRAHCTGVATRLLDALDALVPATRATVSTGTANTPALALYRSRGFRPVGTTEIAPGVTLSTLERRCPLARSGMRPDRG
ncbi:GNAT family N-acetyltransferase [Amycolatopsis sp. CA-230715]|uniref:GNAT family N-acetyltransferase n=1 Tax=Amycolatopsis sp. CA-230715 TaxID=2745196 RepID=UPI001C028AAC|nr:GNAT family N-acetyltransferase [Amycolatopsis sp. CA-230715]QWF84708.1 hypothetical protein HUW46_08160 [Amycolatopsis sp. CA-230715]